MLVSSVDIIVSNGITAFFIIAGCVVACIYSFRMHKEELISIKQELRTIRQSARINELTKKRGRLKETFLITTAGIIVTLVSGLWSSVTATKASIGEQHAQDSLFKLNNKIADTGDSTLKNTKRLVDSINIISQSTLMSLQNNNALLEGQKKVLENNSKIISGVNDLSVFQLIDKRVLPSVRVAFAFEKPSRVLHFNGPKFFPENLQHENGDLGRFFGGGDLIFPNFRTLAHSYIAEYRFNVDGFPLISGSIDFEGNSNTNTLHFTYYENNNYTIAFEHREKLKEVNMAKFVDQIKKTKSEIYLKKRYNKNVSLDDIHKNEDKFLKQGLSYFIEIPLLKETGVSYKIALKQKGKYKIVKIHGDEEYYSVEYTWDAVSGGLYFGLSEK